VQLRTVNKKQYRKRLKNTTLAVITTLFVGSLSISALFITLLGSSTESNFNLNLASVFITLILVGMFFINAKSLPYFDEMFYVWKVKFELSHIQRNIKKIESAAKKQNELALIVLAYYYQATHQIWLLDDNTLTIEEFLVKESRFKEWVLQSNHNPDVNKYTREHLKQFK